jgi:putative membrane protein
MGSIMNRSRILIATLLLCATGSASLAQDTATSAQSNASSAQSNASAKEFVDKAGTSGLAEVEMGELGAQKAKNGEVKAFAKRMVADHTKANQELLTAIKGKGMQVPSSQSDMHKATMAKFRQQDAGKSFDRAYMEQMVEDHKAAVELFETAADDAGLDINLRGYAKQTLPALRDHLKQAQTIQSKLAD